MDNILTSPTYHSLHKPVVHQYIRPDFTEITRIEFIKEQILRNGKNIPVHNKIKYVRINLRSLY